MNICFFSAQYLPTLGGVERYTYNLAIELISRGHKVSVVTSSIKGMPSHETDPSGILIYRATSLALVGGRLPVLLQGSGIAQFLSSFNPDKIIVQTQLYTLSLFGVKYANKHQIPVILLGHASGHIFSNPSLIKRGTDMYEHLLSKLIKKQKCQFYGVSQQSMAWFTHFGISATDTVYNSVPMHMLSDIGEYDMPSHTLNITFVGRLIAEKGIVQLCQAVASLAQGGHEVRLYVIGEGELYDSLRNKYNATTMFLGGLPHSEVLAVLRQSDVYCLPSDAEGFPTALLEAAACETYLITTPCGGSNELLGDGTCGEIIKDNTVQSIEKALLFALQNRDTVAQKARNAKEKALSQFSITATCDKLLALINTIK